MSTTKNFLSKKVIIVDAGNGNVLYTSEGQPLGSFGHLSLFRDWNEHRYKGLDMPWKGNDGDNGSNTTLR